MVAREKMRDVHVTTRVVLYGYIQYISDDE